MGGWLLGVFHVNRYELGGGNDGKNEETRLRGRISIANQENLQQFAGFREGHANNHENEYFSPFRGAWDEDPTNDGGRQKDSRRHRQKDDVGRSLIFAFGQATAEKKLVEKDGFKQANPNYPKYDQRKWFTAVHWSSGGLSNNRRDWFLWIWLGNTT